MHENTQYCTHLAVPVQTAWPIIDAQLAKWTDQFHRYSIQTATVTWPRGSFGELLQHLPYGDSIRIWKSNLIWVAYHDVSYFEDGGRLIVAFPDNSDHEFAMQVFETLRQALSAYAGEQGK